MILCLLREILLAVLMFIILLLLVTVKPVSLAALNLGVFACLTK